MSAVKRILVLTDFSEGSKAALKYACELADASNASLSILHTVENPHTPAAYTEYSLRLGTISTRWNERPGATSRRL